MPSKRRLPVIFTLSLSDSTLMLSTKCSLLILSSHFIPLMDELRERAIRLWQDEQCLSASRSSRPEDDSATDRQQELVEVRTRHMVFRVISWASYVSPMEPTSVTCFFSVHRTTASLCETCSAYCPTWLSSWWPTPKASGRTLPAIPSNLKPPRNL